MKQEPKSMLIILLVLLCPVSKVALADRSLIPIKNDNEIHQIFSGASDVRWPVDEVDQLGKYFIEFSESGSWDGNFVDGRFGIWGKWKAKNENLCFDMDGGNTQWVSPFVGCTPILVDKETGFVYGSFPSIDKRNYLLTDNKINTVEKIIGNKREKKSPAVFKLKKDDVSERWIDRNKIKEIHYKLEDGSKKKLKILNITDTNIEFDNYTEWVSNFAVNGMKPYSPGHSNLETTIISDIPEKFLDSKKGQILKYKVQEEWNDNYGMLWEINVKIKESGLITFNNVKIEGIILEIFGKSVKQNGFSESSWHQEGVAFEEMQIIDRRSRILLKRKRNWKNRVSKSPENEQQILDIDKIIYRDGTVISWNKLAFWLGEGERRKAELVRKEVAEKKRLKLVGEEETRKKIFSVQNSLSKLGIYEDKIDGNISPRLLSSIIKWSNDSGFLFKGIISSALVSILEIKSSQKEIERIKAIEQRKKEKIARQKEKIKRKAELASKRAKEKRKAEIARKKIAAKRVAEMVRKKEKEKRKSELARKKAEEKQNNHLYEANIAGALHATEIAEIFLTENSDTMVLADASIALLSVKNSIKQRHGKSLVENLRVLKNLLNDDEGYREFFENKTSKRIFELKSKLKTYDSVMREILIENIERGSGSVKDLASKIKVIGRALKSNDINILFNDLDVVKTFLNADPRFAEKLKLSHKEAELIHKNAEAEGKADSVRKRKKEKRKINLIRERPEEERPSLRGNLNRLNRILKKSE